MAVTMAVAMTIAMAVAVGQDDDRETSSQEIQTWQLAGWPLGTMEAKTGLHTGVLGMPRRLDPQPGLHTGV